MFEREKGRGGEDLTSGEYGIEIYNLNAPQLRPLAKILFIN